MQFPYLNQVKVGNRMIKKCKQCGAELKPSESNQVCQKCREKKKDQQVELRKALIDKKRKR